MTKIEQWNLGTTTAIPTVNGSNQSLNKIFL